MKPRLTKSKTIVCITEILINPKRGLASQTIWYSDGSKEENIVPKYHVIIARSLI